MTTLEQIQLKLEKLQAQADALLARKSQDALNEIRGLMEKHGLSTADIDAHTGGKKRGPKPASKGTGGISATTAKYRDPKSGATWSGRGRAPGWIAKERDHSRFLMIDGVTSLTDAVPARKSKTTGNYPRGPQPIKYRNPKTGATWSGRGPAPAWLRSVKDRSKFLIVGNDGGERPVVSKVADRQPARKATGKKKSESTAVAAKESTVKQSDVKKVGAKKPKPSKPRAPTTQTPTSTVEKVAAKKTRSTNPVFKIAEGERDQMTQIPAASAMPAAAEALNMQPAE